MNCLVTRETFLVSGRLVGTKLLLNMFCKLLGLINFERVL